MALLLFSTARSISLQHILFDLVFASEMELIPISGSNPSWPQCFAQPKHDNASFISRARVPSAGRGMRGQPRLPGAQGMLQPHLPRPLCGQRPLRHQRLLQGGGTPGGVQVPGGLPGQPQGRVQAP